MERVAFLIEKTGARIGCLLNPESLVVRRVAGVRSRRSAGGELTGAGLTDDPLLYTGGGRTELELDLLFDVNLAGSSLTTDDVRDLTRPLVELAENAASDDPYGRPPMVRFVWGKSWNIPGVVTTVAERLEQFTPEGAPQRSWLRMRLVRVSETLPQTPGAVSPLADGLLSSKALEELETLNIPEQSITVHEILGAGEDEQATAAQRLDEIAAHYYDDRPEFWRVIAWFNHIDDPLRLLAGWLLRIPPVAYLLRAR
jgi:hypothetical protein